MKRALVQKRFYSDKVVTHFNQPKNIGSLDKTKSTVGTAIVGSPACFSGDTIIALDGDAHYDSLESLYKKTRDGFDFVKVMSYNIAARKFEGKWAKIVYSGKKQLDVITLSNGNNLRVTWDHKFLLEKSLEYVDNNKINSMIKGYELIKYKNGTTEIKKNPKGYMIDSRKKGIIEDCYTLQVAENNNYCVLSEIHPFLERGIVVKNCGDVIKFQIEVKDNKIVDSKCKIFGCASAIASTSYLSELVEGKTIDEAKNISNKEIANHLALPPVKLHCSMLAEDAIKIAINDWDNKQKIVKQQMGEK